MWVPTFTWKLCSQLIIVHHQPQCFWDMCRSMLQVSVVGLFSTKLLRDLQFISNPKDALKVCQSLSLTSGQGPRKRHTWQFPRVLRFIKYFGRRRRLPYSMEKHKWPGVTICDYIISQKTESFQMQNSASSIILHITIFSPECIKAQLW